MRYEVIMNLESKVLFNVEADSDEAAIQLVKDTQPLWHTLESNVTSWEAIPEPNL